MPIVRRVPRRFAKPPDVGPARLPHYKIFESKQAAERLAMNMVQRNGCADGFIDMEFLRALVVTKEEIFNSE